ncbi:MAG TPA: hypothetical protein VGM98_07905 [Schlesneria sp.]|jgi:hypothetical protein
MFQIQFVDTVRDGYVAQLKAVKDPRITIRLSNPVLGSLKAMAISAVGLFGIGPDLDELKRIDDLFNRIAAR